MIICALVVLILLILGCCKVSGDCARQEEQNYDDVKHGYWIIHSDWAECSECHVCGSPQWKVCPVCETRMEETHD